MVLSVNSLQLIKSFQRIEDNSMPKTNRCTKTTLGTATMYGFDINTV